MAAAAVVEVPALRARGASRLLAWVALAGAPADERERRVFAIYGALALVYSATILYLLAGLVFGWVSRTLGALGVLLFALALWAMLRGGIREWGRAVVTTLREHRDRWRSPKALRRAGGVALVLVLVAVLVPWPLTVGGRFVADPVMAASLVAPDEGAVERVYATEGTTVSAGAPVVRLQNFDLQQQALEYERVADSLDNRAEVARAAGRTGEAERLGAAEAEQGALLEGTETRLSALVLRAPVAGVVATPRLEEAIGMWVDTGTVVARVVEADSVEVRVTLDRAGATLVRPGDRVRLVSYADPSRPVSGTVRTVSAAAGGGGRLEARIRLAASPPAWRVGVTGEARIEVRRTNLLGAILWGIRKRLRSDLLL